jgi:hypothetical protein
LVNTLLGGRIFPGFHHRADFRVEEAGDRVSILMRSRDDQGRVEVRGHVGDRLPVGSVFGSLEQVSTFFRKDALGYSRGRGRALEGLELETSGWSVVPFDIEHVSSSFFFETTRFPEGSVEFDDALLMRNVGHRWRAREDLYAW